MIVGLQKKAQALLTGLGRPQLTGGGEAHTVPTNHKKALWTEGCTDA
jgi:hypothetical protein